MLLNMVMFKVCLLYTSLLDVFYYLFQLITHRFHNGFCKAIVEIIFASAVIDVHIHHFYRWIINFGYYLFDERSLAHASDVYQRQKRTEGALDIWEGEYTYSCLLYTSKGDFW